MSRPGSRVAHGMGWLLSASFVSKALGAASMLVLTRILAPEDFGLVALATTLLGILTVVTELQLTNALIGMRQVAAVHLDTVFTLSAARGLVVALALFVGGHALAAIYHEPRLVPLTAWLCLDPVISGLRSPRFAMFDKELRFAYSAVVETLGRTAAFLAAVVFALATRSYWALPIGQVAAAAAIGIAGYVAAPYRPRLSLSAWRPVLGFSIWLNLVGILSTLSSRLDNFFVAGFLSKAVLGQYVIGNQLAMLVSEALLQPLQRVLFPGFARLTADRDRLCRAYIRSQAGLTSIGVPIGILVALMARPGVELVIGPRWPIAAQVIEYVAPVFGVQIVFGPVNALALALGETRALFLRSLCNLVLRLPGILIGLGFDGLRGLLIARIVVGGLFLALADATLVSRILGLSLRRQVAVGGRSLASAGVLLAAGIFFRGLVPMPRDSLGLMLYLAAIGTGGSAIYVAFHYALWRADGRGDGPERDVIAILRAIGRKRQPAT